jgi:hypothetical protein
MVGIGSVYVLNNRYVVGDHWYLFRSVGLVQRELDSRGRVKYGESWSRDVMIVTSGISCPSIDGL